jgi:hypothetical protein
MGWNKEADWIPYFNALDQVIFWKDDLIKALNSLNVLDQMDYPKDSKGYSQSLKEIGISERGLALAKFKLKRSFKRLTESDKTTWMIPNPK